MPDLHIYCKNLKNALDISFKLHKKIYYEIRKLNREYVSIYNTTKEFFSENKDFFMKLLEIENKPILINFVPEGIYYWGINVEYTIIDTLGRPREIATFQIDLGNAKRFDISFIGEKGEKHYPPIIHTAIIGTIERYLFTLFDVAAREEKSGKKPELPLWLTPSQVRLIPVSMSYLKYAQELCDRLNNLKVRTDIDDRDETVPKRIRDAEINWIPYIIVIGEKEINKKILPIRMRSSNKQEKMSINDLVEKIHRITEGHPFRPLPFPDKTSLRPIYK
jgi:threonyl-tRNA synthetase